MKGRKAAAALAVFYCCIQLTKVIILDSAISIEQDVSCGTTWCKAQSDSIVYTGKAKAVNL